MAAHGSFAPPNWPRRLLNEKRESCRFWMQDLLQIENSDAGVLCIGRLPKG